MATLKDIAKIANVNVSTVSKALRNSSDLSDETKFTIRSIADELNYPYSADGTPRRANLIGVILPDITSPYYNTALHSLQSKLMEYGYRVMVMYSLFDKDEECACFKELIRNRVSAVVCFSTNSVTPTKFRDLVQKSTIPVLLIGKDEDCDFCDNIFVNRWKSVQMAVDHLLALGHRQIAYLGEPLSTERRKAFSTAMMSRNVNVPNEYVIETDKRFEACGYEGMKKLLELPSRPTAVFAAYDSIAIGAMRAIKEAGLSIPDDISIVGIDDSNIAKYLSVQLTSVTEPTHDLGDLAADVIMQKMSKRHRIMQNIKLPPTLKVRESTAPLANR